MSETAEIPEWVETALTSTRVYKHLLALLAAAGAGMVVGMTYVGRLATLEQAETVVPTSQEWVGTAETTALAAAALVALATLGWVWLDYRDGGAGG